MAGRIPEASAAVRAARARRAPADLRIEWFISRVLDRVELSMSQRLDIATKFVESQVVKNISRPVTKGVGPRGGRVVTDRSRPGEFPKADTTQLMKSIFSHRRGDAGYIGTPLDYGLILELHRDRSFLVRTLSEELDRVRRILTARVA